MKYLIICIAIVLSSCSSQKINETMMASDFQTGLEPYYQSWSGGAPGSSSGVSLYFPASILEGNQFLAVYFRGMEKKIASFTSNNKKMLVTRFDSPQRDREMSLDPKKEYGNESPSLENLPFQLNNDQAIVAFLKNGKTIYVKLDGIDQKETIAYPSAPPQGNRN
ncbi:hypothetical protein [Nonlabens sp. Asnod3-A02]|uniref:hypothetical protein n=1 Tax=Nonlabens sp. Asnod3-A02 TaxID=3160579 RepID=UPI0038634806